MHTIVPFTPDHLDQLTRLVDVHVSSVVPGWAIPPSRLAARLERDPGEHVVDPWVVERRTLVAVECDRVVAATHLLRYGDAEAVGPAYRGQSEIAWLLAWPDAGDAAATLLEDGLQQLDAWGSPERWAFDSAIYSPMTSGIPDAWPHLAALARDAGLAPNVERTEYLHLGWIPHSFCEREALVDFPPREASRGTSLSVRRTAVDAATRFAAVLDGVEIGIFDVEIDDGWGDPVNLWVEPEHRSRGIGTWLVRTACGWLRLGGIGRMVVSVDLRGHLDGAGRFYERLGWPLVATFERGWTAAGPA